MPEYRAIKGMLLLVLATGFSAIAGLADASDAAATNSSVESVAGHIEVVLDDDTRHKIAIEDSTVNLHPGVVAFVRSAAFEDAAVTITALTNKKRAAAMILAALLAGIESTKGLILKNPDLTSNAEGKVKITELEPDASPLESRTGACSSYRESGKTPAGAVNSDKKTTATKYMECSVIRGPRPQDGYKTSPAGVASRLMVVGGDSEDIILLQQHRPQSLDWRLIYGAAGNDKILGSRFDDQLIGADGSDLINGHGGDDWIQGYTGDDDIGLALDYETTPDGGRETYFTDNDTLIGEAGRDVIVGGQGDDLISGGPGDDNRTLPLQQVRVIWPGLPVTGDVALNGGAGDDVVIGGPGRDRMEGGSDRDTVLARESDFGQPDQADELIDCGPNRLRPVRGDEYVRRAAVDLPAQNCQQELVSGLSPYRLAAYRGDTPWWWYAPPPVP